MTWKHVASLLVAAGLVLGCGVSHVCSAPGTLSGVLALATGIVGGVFGHASHARQEQQKAKPKRRRKRLPTIVIEDLTGDEDLAN